MLAVDEVTTKYGALTALHAVSLHVNEGELVALVGPNGAGKTTLLSTVVGLLRPTGGTVRFDGRTINGLDPAALVAAGLALVPERRRIFKDLSVAENLRLAGVTAKAPDRKQRMEQMAELFPALHEKWDLSAGFLSGGQAQQLAVARALMCDPKLLLLDEPCLGLAPTMVDVIFDLLQRLRSQGRTVLVVEQQAQRVLGIADRGYVLRTGTVVAEGAGPELASRADLFETYVGGS
ncbi:MAG: ABC transporter ATP-binding protein [Actinomycetota bacterium]|jgi:branched-chain amino acid transport system ATP-binding protein|nr:MAG: branched-chain amino acid transport system ATP-binding protein [Acidimicrobiaceae bacterium]